MQTAELKNAILVNGEKSAVFPVGDRGLQYGHGLFETIAIKQGQLQHWDRHMARLVKGCTQLSIKSPDLIQLKNEAQQLTNQKDERDQKADQAVLKIIYTCGEGGRGYKTPDQSQANRILSLSDWPDYPVENDQTGVTVRLCETHLGSNPALAGVKHLNRLEQVLARSEWSDPDIAEGLMLDARGLMIEGTMSNVFFVKNDTLCTPALTQCGVAGVMRELVLELAESIGVSTYIDDFTPADIFQADEVFLTNSLIGIWPVNRVSSDQNVVYDPTRITTPKLVKLINEQYLT